MTGAAPGEFVPPPSCWRVVGVYGTVRPTCPWLATWHHCRNCEVFQAAGRALFRREPLAEHLEAWGRQLAEPPPVPAGAREDVLVLELGDRRVAVPVTAVRAVVNARTIRRLPPPHDAALLGLVSVRGELLPCLALEVVLGWPALDPAEGRRLVVLGTSDEDAAALLVTEVAAVRSIEVVAQTPDHLPDQVLERPLVRQVLRVDAADVPLLDATTLDDALRRRG